MSFINIEIKARTEDPERIRKILLENNADFKGTDEQTDSYFRIPHGRLKLRQGKIENSLIYYTRVNQDGPKQSDCDVWPAPDAHGLRDILEKSLGILVTVTKKREIYFIDNIKFHIDTVEGLGNFVEIEASNKVTDIPKEILNEQCRHYMKLFGIKDAELVEMSYSDMLLSSDQVNVIKPGVS